MTNPASYELQAWPTRDPNVWLVVESDDETDGWTEPRAVSQVEMLSLRERARRG